MITDAEEALLLKGSRAAFDVLVGKYIYVHLDVLLGKYIYIDRTTSRR